MFSAGSILSLRNLAEFANRRFGRSGSPAITRKRRRVPNRGRLRVELLEDRTVLTPWAPMGPAPIVNGQVPGNQPVSGRLTALAADPSDPNTLYVAAAGGGVWKTTDAGTTWTPLTDSVPIPFMGALALAPSNPNVIYAGTGEANNGLDSYYGRGILKSTDAGATWTLLGNSVFDRRAISKIVVDPTNPNVVYAGVTSRATNGLSGNAGVWKSTNGGTTWVNLTPAIADYQAPFVDLVLDPRNPRVLYAALGDIQGQVLNDIWKTTDGGLSWFPLTGVDGNIIGRTALAVSPTNPQVLYASVVGTGKPGSAPFGSLLAMIKSTNGGFSWTVLGNTPDYFGDAKQGWYDTTLAVDPSNPNIVYAGGAGDPQAKGSLFIGSPNGGLTWFDLSGIQGNVGGPHADHHGIGFDANGRLLVGTDGGIWRLEDPVTVQWSDLNGNLQITQFTGIALHPSDPTIIYGGSQDNGTEKYSGDPSLGWNLVAPGDGGYVRVDPSNPQTVYHTFFGPSLQRSDDGGNTWAGKTSGIDLRDPSNFYAIYKMDPSNPSRLLLGTNRVYETTDRADSWVPISPPAPAPIDALGVAPSNPDILYAAAGGRIFVTFDHGFLWQERDAGRIDSIADIFVDPGNALVAYAVSNRFNAGLNVGQVWMTTNGGFTWSNISGNLPDVPAWTIVVDPLGSGIYVGNDLGVFVSQDTGASWTLAGEGLPFVQVVSLEVNPTLGLLAAGTHGRGVWELALTAPKSLGASPAALLVHGDRVAERAAAFASPSPFPTVILTAAPVPTRRAAPPPEVARLDLLFAAAVRQEGSGALSRPKPHAVSAEELWPESRVGTGGLTGEEIFAASPSA